MFGIGVLKERILSDAPRLVISIVMGCGIFLGVACIGPPPSPANQRLAYNSPAMEVSWDAVSGAEYYNIYHDHSGRKTCRVNPDGEADDCTVVDIYVLGTIYAHYSPDSETNYYWVVACDERDSCSEVQAENPAQFAEDRPGAPQAQKAFYDGYTIHIEWEAVSGADYYKIYHDDFFSGGKCVAHRFRGADFCDEVAESVAGTTWVHNNPRRDENHYWVAACNSSGCSGVDAGRPAHLTDVRLPRPTNVRTTRHDATMQVTWNSVTDADYYKIYYDDFFDSNCRVTRNREPFFCDELAVVENGTTYTHDNPGDRENHYWVAACNSYGCSDIIPERRVRRNSGSGIGLPNPPGGLPGGLPNPPGVGCSFFTLFGGC